VGDDAVTGGPLAQAAAVLAEHMAVLFSRVMGGVMSVVLLLGDGDGVVACRCVLAWRWAAVLLAWRFCGCGRRAARAEARTDERAALTQEQMAERGN